MQKNENSTLEFYFVNKFNWPTATPMVYVSTMSTYYLAQTGFKTTLITSGDPQYDVNRELRESFSLTPLPEYGIKLFKKFRILRKKKLTLVFYLQTLFYIMRKRSTKPVIISRNTTFLPYLWLLKMLTGGIAVFETHGYHGTKTLRGLPARGKRRFGNVSFYYMILERIFLNRLDAVVCITHPQQQVYQADFLRTPSIVLPIGAPFKSGECIDAEQAYKKRNVVFIGRLRSNADSEVLLRACRLCMASDIHFTWIGLDDSSRRKLSGEIEKYDIAKSFTLKTWMSPRDLRSYIIDNASAGIAAYRPDYRSEVVTSPTKIFDYFSLGLPVIAASMPTITSVMTDGSEGLLYKAGDPESLADAIKNLLSNQSRYLETHKNVLRAAEEFSYSNRSNKLVSFIGSQIEGVTQD